DFATGYILELTTGLECARIQAGGFDVGVDRFRALCRGLRVPPGRTELARFEVMQRQDIPGLLGEIHLLFHMCRDPAMELSSELERQPLVGRVAQQRVAKAQV